MLLNEVGTYLQANAIGTLGTDLFLGFMPEKPDACVALYETGGLEPYRAMRGSPGSPVAERPRIQIVCRNTQYEYAAAREKARAINVLLDQLGETTLSGTRYLWVAAAQSPFLMGRDDARRVLIAVNFDVVKELSAA